jgi:WD40 repeat protein
LRDVPEAANRLTATADGRVVWCAPSQLGGCIVEPSRSRREIRRNTRVMGHHSGAVSADGKLWAHLNHQDVDLYDVSERKRLRSLTEHRGRVRAGSFAPDGKQLACISHRLDDYRVSHTNVCVWNVADGKLARTITIKAGLRGTDVAFSAGGLVAVVGEDEDGIAFLRVYDAPTGGEVARAAFARADGAPIHVAFSRDGKVLAVGMKHSLRLWRVVAKEGP